MNANRQPVGACIAGAGPAGAMLGLLLARAGVDVVVLEKHGDFLRDFRGDTIHPSTLEILDELGLAERFLKLPHSEVRTVRATGPQTGPDRELLSIPLAGLRTRFPFVAFVPQWDFLTFVTREAKRYPGFRLELDAEVLDLVREGDAVRGVRYRTRAGEREARALVTVGADGRDSRTRAAAGLPVVESSPPMDVFWFRIPRHPTDPADISLRVAPGHLLAFLNRGDSWQVAYVIPKGSAERVRGEGIDAFRRSFAAIVPELADRAAALESFDQVKLLSVQANRLRRWFVPGYLAIGDAAHAMSPIAGVGINVAIQDAVAAANVLWRPLREGTVSERDLARVQHERELPVRVIQGFQSLLQRGVVSPALERTGGGLPRAARTLSHLGPFRRLLAHLVGLGFRRPHVRSPELRGPEGAIPAAAPA